MELTKQLEEQISNLSKYIRDKVTVTYVEGGEIFTENGELEEVDTGNNGGRLKIKLFNEMGVSDGLNLPFLGSFSTAIQQVTDEKGNVLYENRLVDKSYKNDSHSIEKKCESEKI